MSSLADRICETEDFQKGLPMRPLRLAEKMNERPGSVRVALYAMVDTGHCVYDNGVFFKNRRHWVNRAPLNDPAAMQRAREAYFQVSA